MPLGQCLRRHTQRQFNLIQAWFFSNTRRNEDLPTVVQYLMQIGRETRATRAENPSQVNWGDLRIRYETPPKPGDPGYFEVTPEMEEAFMQAAHGMGGN